MTESADDRRPSSVVLGSFWERRTSLVVLVASILHCGFAAATGFSDTEAYYAEWGRFPALSYYDHPPLIAWTTWLAWHALGSSRALRAGPVLYAAVFDALLYRLTARIFTPRAGFYAVVLVNALPVFGFIGFLINPEALLAPLWVLFLSLLLDLREHDEPWRPLAVAITIGIAFLAKYTAVLAIPVALLFVASSGRTRRWIRRRSLYLSALTPLPIAAPVIAWNALRGWPSVRLHFVERVQRALGESFAQGLWRVERGQLFIFQPILQPALLAVLATILVKARRDVRYRFLATASLPVLAFLVAMMIHVPDSEPQWTMVGYVPLLAGAGGLLDEGTGALRRVSHVVFNLGVLTSIVIGVAFSVQLSVAIEGGTLPSYNPSASLLRETVGWERVKAAVDAHVAKLGSRAVVAGAHNVFCGHLQMAMDDSPPVYCVAARLTHFDFIGRRRPPHAAPVVFVDSDRDPEDPGVVMPNYDCSRAQEVDVRQSSLALARYRIRDCILRK